MVENKVLGLMVIGTIVVVLAVIFPVVTGKVTNYTHVITPSGRINEVCIGGYKVYQTSEAITQKLESDGKPERC